MLEDWAAVARTINERLTILGMNQGELAKRANVALSIVRELRHNTKQRRRSGRTLEALSEALELDRRYLAHVALGQQPPAPNEPAVPTADHRLDAIEDRLSEIVRRLGAVDAKLDRMIDIVWPNLNR